MDLGSPFLPLQATRLDVHRDRGDDPENPVYTRILIHCSIVTHENDPQSSLVHPIISATTVHARHGRFHQDNRSKASTAQKAKLSREIRLRDAVQGTPSQGP